MRSSMHSSRVVLGLLVFTLWLCAPAGAQDRGAEVAQKLKGFGYRDYEKKLPVKPDTLFPIASNTKLFTAIAAGFLVEEGKLTWNRPIRESVPSIQFYNDYLWYKADYDEKTLFERLKYLEPKEPPRQMFLYNNMMYAGVGYATQLQSGKPWAEYVREKILQPLGMKSTVFTIADMLKQPDYGVPFTEKRDSLEIYRIPYYEETN